MQRRANDIDHRRKQLQQRRDTLIDQRRELTRDNQLRTRIAGFAERVLAVIDQLTFDQRQQLLRLVVEEVRVTGWNVQIQLRIPLDGPHEALSDHPNRIPPGPVSTEDGLRSLGGDDVAVV
jgi:hypothetical protein